MLKPLTHTGTVLIETARVRLRPMKPDDAAQMFRNWSGDPEAAKYIISGAHTDIGVTRRELEQICEQSRKADFYYWGIELKDTAELVGAISIYDLDEHCFSCALSFSVGKRWWNLGLTTEAARAVIAHMFKNVGINRIHAAHDTNNPASGRVMQKCGMALEGVFRQQLRDEKRGFFDCACYAILRQDYCIASEGE